MNPDPASETVSDTTTPPRAWGRRFLTKRFLFASLALHLLLAVGAALWITHDSGPARAKPPAFTGHPASQTAQRAVEHKVKLAERRSLRSAPPALRRVLSQRSSAPALPAVPTLPDTPPMMPVALTGSGHAPGMMGFGLPRPSGAVGSGAAVTQFIGGLRVTAQKLGVALDVSGSVRDYQQAMHAHVGNVFKGSKVTEFTTAGFYRMQPPHASIGSAMLDFLNSPQRFDAIYVFSDFGETREKIPAGHEDLWPEVQRLVREKKTRLYLHVLRKPNKEGNTNPTLDAVIQFARSTGGSVKIGPMLQVAAGGDGSGPANPL